MSYDELKKELFPELMGKLVEFHTIVISASGVLKIDSEKVDHKNFSTWFLTLCKDELFKPYNKLILEAPSTNVLFDEFRKALKLAMHEKKNHVKRGLDVIKDYDFMDLIPFVSIENANLKMFYNKKNGEIYPLDFKTYEITVDKEVRIVPVRAVIKFNPYRPESIYVAESDYGKECTHINTFKRPEWQMPRELTLAEREEYCKLPPIIDKFMSHLFPDKNCREFVYDWLHFSLAKRCETYLVLNGAKGIGKGIFTDHICRYLIGKDNYLISPAGGLESNFNAMLEANRLIVFDEFRIDDEGMINKLKRYINKDQTIEHKGQDVGKTIETFNSFIISSNSLNDMRISWDDRRFSVADITNNKLEEVWTKEDIQELLEELGDNTDTMQKFGYWLLYRRTKDNEFACYKGNHFYKLCYSSLPEWSKVVIDEVTSGTSDIYDDGTLKMAYKTANPLGKFPNQQKVKDFLVNYKHEGKHYLGEFKQDIGSRSWYIKTSDDFYKPMGQDNTGIQWEDVL
jgi:hypothetical protein